MAPSLAFVVYYVCFDQMQNNLISQASQMNTGNTPNDLLPAMNQVACIILAPLIAHGFYPWLEKKGIYLKPVTRITIGFVFITLSMLYAAAVQHAIYQSGPCYEYPKDCNTKIDSKGDRPNVWMQLPLYFLLAASEVFGMTTAMEYAEKHAPKGMQVLVQAINMLIMGAGSAVALAIAEAARDPYLVWFYTALTIGMATTTLIFFLIFRNYDRDHPTTAPDSETVTVTEKESVSTTPSTSYPASVMSSVHGSATRITEKETESVPASGAHPAVMREQVSPSRTNAAHAAGENDPS
jgi:POT family proton-dependent oligopeptide transporter